MNITYDNIKIKINGIPFLANDINGNVIEPFICSGTTYLPVRGIANAFNRNVSWIAEKSQIKLDTSEAVFLSNIQFEKYTHTNSQDCICKYNDKYFSNTVSFVFLRDYDKDNEGSEQYVEYLVPNEKTVFNADVSYGPGYQSQGSIRFVIYGDNEIIHTSPSFETNVESIPLTINISKYKKIGIKAICSNYSTVGSLHFQNAKFE